MKMINLWSNNKSDDDIDTEAAFDPERVILNLIEDIKVLREFHKPMLENLKLVAHVGVDFGYGEFKITDDHIKNARLLLEDIEDN